MATGLYANIHAKRKRIAEGSGEKMKKPGTKGAPTKKDFQKSAKTAKKWEIGLKHLLLQSVSLVLSSSVVTSFFGRIREMANSDFNFVYIGSIQ